MLGRIAQGTGKACVSWRQFVLQELIFRENRAVIEHRMAARGWLIFVL
jgi:hypothetical protein